MRNKTTWLTLLICLNLALLLGLGLAVYTPRAANAQTTGLADNYLLVAGRIQSDFDAVYVLDLDARTLNAFFFRRGSTELVYGGFRNLERDFRFNR